MSEDKEFPFAIPEGALPPCEIFIDREGEWFHRGSRMQRRDIVGLLCQNIRKDQSSGLYIVQLGKQRCYLEVEDTPLVISQVMKQETGEKAEGEQLLLWLKHLESSEPLDPTSLWVGKENVLYCCTIKVYSHCTYQCSRRRGCHH